MLLVDNQPVVTGQTPSPIIGATLDGDLWLGGYVMFMNISSLTGTSVGFSGCLSSLTLNGREVELVMEAEHGFGVGQCNISRCSGSPCLNNGSCVEAGTNFICVCSGGYTGQLCASQVDPCNNVVCENGGTCQALLGDDNFECLCPLYKGGTLCEQGEVCTMCQHIVNIRIVEVITVVYVLYKKLHNDTCKIVN